MADIEQSAEDTVDALLAKARKGVGAEGAKEYYGGYLWARLWKSITSIANCPPDLSSLLMYRADIAVCMKIAQEMQLDMINAEVATKRMKELFSAKPI